MSGISTSESHDTPVDDGNSLRKRVLEDPRPAVVWFGVFAFLILIELPKYAGSIGGLTGAVSFALDGIKGVPGWIGGNIGDGIASVVSATGMAGASDLNTIVSAFAEGLVVIGILFVFATLITGYVLPWHVADRFDLDVTRRRRVYLDRLVVAGVLTVLAGLLAFTPLGGIISGGLSSLGSVFDSIGQLPSLTDRNVIDNVGHRSPDGSGWEGTFLGLSPKWAWGLRVVVVYAYALALLAWLWKGYNVYRQHYREADWTPRDDTIRRFRGHSWGMFGLIIVVMFVVLAFWAPTISPVTAEANIYTSYQHEFQYLSSDGEVATTTHGAANVDSHSTGGESDVGPWSYDDYGRWQPAGTTPNGYNMMTNLAYGAQTSLIIGVISIGLGGLIAVLVSLITAYYKGITDVLAVIASDTIISIPAFLLVMMISVLFNQGNHPLAEPMDGGLLLALTFAFVFWPSLWRSIRGPSLQVAEEEWIDAAKSYGQRPLTTMRKHMAPYVAGYLLIYASLTLGGIIIATAALSFLGLGINPPTPEWGRLIASGQPYLSQGSWHISTISGLMIVLVVTAFNALGDGLRDAIDPEADIENQDGGAAAGGGG